MHHCLSCSSLVGLHMLQQNYQKPTSSQGVVSSRVLAVPDTQNFNCKHSIKNILLFYSSSDWYYKPPSVVGFYCVFTVVFTTVPDSTASYSMMTDNMEFGRKRSNLKTISYWHLPGQNKTPADRSEKNRCSTQI